MIKRRTITTAAGDVANMKLGGQLAVLTYTGDRDQMLAIDLAVRNEQQ